MGHRAGAHADRSRLDDAAADVLAATFQALSAPSRLRLLAVLRAGPRTVGDLAGAAGMEQSAVSHQLRLLKDAGFVVADRQGRHVAYRLYDDHVTELLAQAASHVEHVRLGLVD